MTGRERDVLALLANGLRDRQIATRLGELSANILEVDHKRLFLDVPAKGARIDVTVETRDGAHADEILAALAADGFHPARIEAGAAFD